MCEPVSLMAATVGLSAVSAGVGIAGDEQRHSAEEQYQGRLQAENRRQMDENRDLATQAFLDQADAANRSLAEEREATAAANFDKSRQSMEAQGQVLAAAAESGVGGSSLSGILQDFHKQEGMFLQRNNQNLLFKQQQTAAQVRSYRTEAEGRIKSIRPIVPAPIQPVDYIGPALKVVGTGLNAGRASGMFKPSK